MSRSAERIVSLLWLLLEAGAIGRTKSDIFSYLYNDTGTSHTARQRQFSRDKAALAAIGVPVQWRQQTTSDDVYLIDEDRLYLPELDLSEHEIIALHQARALWMRTPIEDAIHTALARLTSHRPDQQPLVGAQLATRQSLLTDLVAAAREQSPIKFRYRAADSQHIATRKVRPWAVIMAHQQWYLVGFDLDRNDQRMFKLSRIESTTIAALPTDVLRGREDATLRPADFNASDIRQRLSVEQPPADAFVWLAAGTPTSLRLRATRIERTPEWDLFRLSYRAPLKTAATIAALTTNAQVDEQRSPQIAALVADILVMVSDAHRGPAPVSVPQLTPAVRPRRRVGDKDVIARRLGIVAVVNQHGGTLDRATLRQRFDIDEDTLTQDLRAMQFWGMPETEFAGGQFEVDPHTDPVTITNAELLAQPWQLSAPEALGLISGLNAVTTIPGISPTQQAAARSLEWKLRAAVEMVAPQVGLQDAVIHPDLSLGDDDEIAETLHRAAREHRVVSLSYYSASAGSITTRKIEPTQLVYSSGHGYVRAWCQLTKETRTFRLDRIGSATVTQEMFSPNSASENEKAIGPDVDTNAITVVLHVTHRHRDVLSAYDPQAVAKAKDGSMFAEVAFRNTDPLLELLTNHPGHITVLEPQNVRADIKSLVDRAMQMPRIGSISHRAAVE